MKAQGKENSFSSVDKKSKQKYIKQKNIILENKDKDKDKDKDKFNDI